MKRFFCLECGETFENRLEGALHSETAHPKPPIAKALDTQSAESIKEKVERSYRDVLAKAQAQNVFSPKSSLDTQIGGDHYKSRAIQPVEFIHANKLGFCEGSVVKYVTRWQAKGGIADLEKAKHYIELLIEMTKEKPE